MRARPLPVAAKLPVVVVVFMASVATIVSWQVLDRLDEAQTRRLRDVAAAHLDGLAAALTDPVIREDVWEVYDALDRSRQDHAGLRPTDTVVASRDDRIIAASDPKTFRSWAALPSQFLTEAAPAQALGIRTDGGKALAKRNLSSGGQPVGTVYATFDLAPLAAERRAVQWTLLATNLGITVGLAILAWLTVRHMTRSLRTLSRHLQAEPGDGIVPIPTEEARRVGAEGRHLYAAFNAMAEAVRERQVLARRLAEEERHASLGRLASGMAHEINNPLGGLFTAIDTLKAHGDRPDVRRRSLDLVERGLKGIRDVVRATLVTHRIDREERDLAPADLDDLRLLVGPEIGRRGLVLTWDNALDRPVAVPAMPLRQVVLNLLLNAAQATPPDGEVSLAAIVDDDVLIITVWDAGPGLDGHGQAVLAGREDGGTAGGPGNGLGLPLVRRLVIEMGGTVASTIRDAGGTAVRVAVPVRRTVPDRLADVA
ncbi:HAMP domain-containing histidine kinase [Methylobacterium sp. C25]|uniref:sensor histidine kinase n=1 Tax=Methylobacterium sp. C25 TaxID=2721622 RepID=UPI001F38CF84|nr:HAMP domain-containing sensor histidine kinase [Methylobacterium sp. C25]MCE4226254.1 HAMP domain-containing histidine kinase [Methylobacterium sp. C25]